MNLHGQHTHAPSASCCLVPRQKSEKLGQLEHDKGEKSNNGRLEMQSHKVFGASSSSQLLSPFLIIFSACAEPRQMQYIKGQNIESAQTQAGHVVGPFQAALSAVTRSCDTRLLIVVAVVLLRVCCLLCCCTTCQFCRVSQADDIPQLEFTSSVADCRKLYSAEQSAWCRRVHSALLNLQLRNTAGWISSQGHEW